MVHPQDYEAAAEYFENRAKNVRGEPDRMARFLAVAAKYRAKAREANELTHDKPTVGSAGQ